MTDDTIDNGPFSAEDIAAHAEHDHLAAVFPDRAAATAAIERLLALGLGSQHLGVAAHGDDPVVFEHDEDRDLMRDTEVGALVGAPIGAIAGVALAGLAIPGIGLIGLGGMFALAGASALWGGMIGGYVGAAAGDEGWNAHRDLTYTALEPGQVLVVVCSHGHADTVRDVMEQHSGRIHQIGPNHLGRRRG
ncbi:MAG TPA: hypothetical protein VK853_09565 [Ilumatobacteraceae bacterium]|nr:hypothetical protein [Ilumatobacteraceae bacterium]